MGYYLRLFSPEDVRDVPLGDRTVIGDHFYPIPDSNNAYCFTKGIDSYKVSSDSSSETMLEGQSIRLSPSMTGLLVQEEPDVLASADVSTNQRIVIGRDTSCSLCLPSRDDHRSDIVEVSRKHAIITNADNGCYVEPVKEQAKVYLNGKRVIKSEFFSPGDTLCVGKYSIVLQNGHIIAHAQKYDPTAPKSEALVIEARPHIEPRRYNRGPHIQTAIPSYELQMPAKENVGEKPEFNWFSTLLPPVAMLVVMLAVFFFTGNVATLMYTIPMYCVTMVVGFVNYQSQKKKFFKKKAAAEESFNKAIEQQQEKIEEIKKQQLAILQEEYPAPYTCVSIVKSMDTRLWRVRPQEEGFMNLRLGTGPVQTRITIPNGASFTESAFISRAQRISDAPVSIPVAKFKTVGIVGNRDAICNLVSNMVLQIATNHSYEEVKTILVYSQDESAQWEWMRWLPHIWDNDHQRRYMAKDNGAIVRLSKEFEETLKMRSSEAKHSVNSQEHHCFIIADRTAMAKLQLMNYLTNNDEELNISTIFMAPTRGQLPAGCQAIIEADGINGRWYPINDSSVSYRFEVDKLGKHGYEEFARLMAPIRLAEGAAQLSFPACVTFLEGYGATTVYDLNILEWWDKSFPEKSMAVPVGVKENGDLLYFDINRKKDGPHGMVAGGTGSGKSDMVQSWILSIALHFKPSEVNFVIVDFKGDGLLAPFRSLPHLVGTISNLDNNVQRNVVALQSELDRRMTLFAECGAHNIEEYFDKYRHGIISNPLPYLIIVIDEFKDFKDNHPEFIPIVNSIYTKGASLGVYCIVLAQDAAAAANGTTIPVNSHFKWCMKVDSDDASQGMLETHDAYVMAKVPGRGYVKVGNFETYERIQAFWSGGYYVPNRQKEINQIPAVTKVEIDGSKTELMEWEKSVGIWSPETEIACIVPYIVDAAKASGVRIPDKIWQAPMGKSVQLEELLEVDFIEKGWTNPNGLSFITGLVDDPKRQSQYMLELSPNECGHVSVQGSPESGKTTFLLTAVLSLVERYDPATVELYLFDYDKWTLNLVRNLPHVKGNTAGADEEEIAAIISRLRNELNKRQKIFLKEGVISLEGYWEKKERIPAVFVIVDNISAAWEDSTALQEILYDIAMKGAGYGIYLIATAPGSTFPYKLTNFFKTKISLYQNDKSDYTAIVGKSDIMPEQYPGRGLIKIGYPVEIQVALPAKGNTEILRNNSIGEIVTVMSANWKSEEHDVPSRPSVKDYFESGNLVLGLDKSSQVPIYFNDSQKHCLVVSATIDLNCKSYIDSIMSQCVSTNNELVVFDDKSGICGEYYDRATRYFTSSDGSADEYLEELMTVLEARKQAQPTTAFPTIVLVIADLLDFFESAEDKSIVYLRDVIALGKNLGVICIVFGNKDGIAHLGYEGEKFTSLLLKESHAVLLDSSIEDHQVFKASLPFSELTRKLDNGSGWYILNEKACEIELLNS